MCQLLGMNANLPATIDFSFTGFRERGGATDDHKDGFGIVFFSNDENGKVDSIHSFYDDKPSYLSPVANFVNEHPVKATNTICHIRKASDGDVALMNNHPFMRELWGQPWIFAHNGQMIDDFRQQLPIVPEIYQPMGSTDSEQAFCYLLNYLRQQFEQMPDEATLFNHLDNVCDMLGKVGIVNLLLSNGQWQLVYSNTLMFYLIRRHPFDSATLIDKDVTIDFRDVNTAQDRIAIMATTPLTGDEAWQQLAVGECIIFKAGDIAYHNKPKQPTYLTIDAGLALAKTACEAV